MPLLIVECTFDGQGQQDQLKSKSRYLYTANKGIDRILEPGWPKDFQRTFSRTQCRLWDVILIVFPIQLPIALL